MKKPAAKAAGLSLQNGPVLPALFYCRISRSVRVCAAGIDTISRAAFRLAGGNRTRGQERTSEDNESRAREEERDRLAHGEVPFKSLGCTHVLPRNRPLRAPALFMSRDSSYQ